MADKLEIPLTPLHIHHMESSNFLSVNRGLLEENYIEKYYRESRKNSPKLIIMKMKKTGKFKPGLLVKWMQLNNMVQYEQLALGYVPSSPAPYTFVRIVVIFMILEYLAK